MDRAEKLFRQALALDPLNVDAMVGVAIALRFMAIEKSYLYSESARKGMRTEAYELATKAKLLDPTHPDAYLPIATHFNAQGDRTGARHALEMALVRDPRSIGLHNMLGLWHLQSVEPGRALDYLNRALDLDPRRMSKPVYSNIGRAHFMMGDYESALGWLLRARQVGVPTEPRMNLIYLAMTYAELSDEATARVMAAEVLRHSPTFRASEFERPGPSYSASYAQWWETRYLPAARKAGLPE